MGLFSCVGKYLTDNNYCASIDSGPAFKSFREAKLTKFNKLKAAGKGNRPNRALPISLAKEEKMWAAGQLGSHEPNGTNAGCLVHAEHVVRSARAP